MGYRARWIAVKNARLATVLSKLGLERQAKSNEAVVDTGFYAVTMPGGWLVVMGDGWDAMESVLPEHARALSAGTEALHFYCDDTPMSASLASFRDGHEVWALDYDGEHDKSDGPAAPVVRGAPPELVGEMIAACLKSQRESDPTGVGFIYDAAPQIAFALTGFRHDETLARGEHLPIFVLVPAKSNGWARLKRLLKSS